MDLLIEIWPSKDKKFERKITGNPLYIGRNIACELTVAMEVVSNKHAKLSFVDGQLWVEDLFSTNGTFLNGVRVTEQTQLSSGDSLQLGAGGPEVKLLELLTTQETKLGGSGALPSTEFKAPIALNEEKTQGQIDAHLSDTVDPSIKQKKTGKEPAAVERSVERSFKIDAIPDVAKKKLYRDLNIRESHRGLHTVLGVIIGLVGMIGLGLFILFVYYLRNPSRGYTIYGMTAGVVGSLLFAWVGIYSFRKRWFQERLGGRLRTWLIVHSWLSVAAALLIFFHAGFHVDFGYGSWALFAMVGTVLTGLFGMSIYRSLPTKAYSEVSNLAIGDSIDRRNSLLAEIEDEGAGKSPEFQKFNKEVLSGGTSVVFAGPEKELPIACRVVELASQVKSIDKLAKRQRSYSLRLRCWLLLHIPLAIAFGVLLAVHVYDSGEIRHQLVAVSPVEFSSAESSPESCQECHVQQYDEWIGSMHAIAQASPVTDLQNRLVLYKEKRDLERGDIEFELVGDLCIKCHAPTGYIGDDNSLHEDLHAELSERAPASQFGVSCVTCHQISKVAGTDAKVDEDGLEYKNVENLTWTAGKAMYGLHGGSGDRPAVGNRFHRSEFVDHFSDGANSKFCASCHTVVVDDPHLPNPADNRIVKLQDTYTEWKEGSTADGELFEKQKKAVKNLVLAENHSWKNVNVQCLDCHGRDLSDIVARCEEMQSDRVDLSERFQAVKEMLENRRNVPFVSKQGDPDFALAATPRDGFDLPLENRRRYLHTFVGVDYHLEENLPYPKGHPLNSQNAKIKRQNLDQVQNLLKVAAAIKVKELRNKNLKVEVANLATGHKLPAGFAFAREMWVEVGFSRGVPRDDGSNVEVLIGRPLRGRGRGNRAVQPWEMLDKGQQGLKNFQAVLYRGTKIEPGQRTDRFRKQLQTMLGPFTGRHDGGSLVQSPGHETVIQNEATGFAPTDPKIRGVLTGPIANDAGYQDRVQFLIPGEIRTLDIPLGSVSISKFTHIRVRLRFRNYPPEFLMEMGRLFLTEENQKSSKNTNAEANAERAFNWVRHAKEDALNPRSGPDGKPLPKRGLRIHDMCEDVVPIRKVER